MIFKIDKSEKVILAKEAVKLCPNLKKLPEKDLLFIIMVWDYDSPYHKFPVDERMRKAKIFVYGSVDAVPESKDSFFSTCAEDYKGLQFDIKRETLRNYEEKILQLNVDLMNESAPRKVREIDEAIERLSLRRTKMQQEIDMDEEAARVIKGGGRISLIEKWQENMRKQKETKKVKEIASKIELI